MNKAVLFSIVGIIISVAGTIAASTVKLPFVFSAGEKAKASEVNSNFNAIASAVNDIDGRVATLEQNPMTTVPEFITVNQVDLPVGANVTIGATTYLDPA